MVHHSHRNASQWCHHCPFPLFFQVKSVWLCPFALTHVPGLINNVPHSDNSFFLRFFTRRSGRQNNCLVVDRQVLRYVSFCSKSLKTTEHILCCHRVSGRIPETKSIEIAVAEQQSDLTDRSPSSRYRRDVSRLRICGRALYATVDSLPSLEMLILTNNKIEQLQVNGVIIIHNRSFSLCLSFQALDPLSMLPSLNHLSLIGNPVTKLPNYRCVKLGSMADSDIRDRFV